jgi:hypothetical protein
MQGGFARIPFGVGVGIGIGIEIGVPHSFG